MKTLIFLTIVFLFIGIGCDKGPVDNLGPRNNPPGTLIATQQDNHTIVLEWTGSPENRTNYAIWRNHKFIGEVFRMTTFYDTSVQCGTPYEYLVTEVSLSNHNSMTNKVAIIAHCN